MKLVCISDTHHKHYYLKLPKGDILVHAGDFSYRGEKIELMLVKEWLNVQAKKYAYIICIAGNHDIGMNKENMKNLAPNIYYLQDSGIELEGLNFYGSPYTVRFGNWGYGEPDEYLAKRWQHIPKKTNVLITHGPPYSILDKNTRNENCGSKALYQRIKELTEANNLKYHIFGHIHESCGEEEIEGVKFLNVSVLDEHYQIKNKPTIIEV